MRERLLDTDILSEILRGQNPHVSARARAYEAAHSHLATSAITVMEIVKGYQRAARKRELGEFLLLLPSLRLLPFDHDEAEVAGRIYGDLERTGRTIGRADPMIASVAIVRSVVLVTGNTAHYQNIIDLGYELELENWRVPASPDE
ncbi:MAG: PIN domain-containing protein [Polyangiaceae bacterium]|jgi:predicted nucleic acid-binding protein|nr:PIN domain-containing protein [Polyangiaceae bacterium]